MAHINMDICGCKGSDVVGFQTSMLEGADFDREFLKGFNEGEPDPPVPHDPVCRPDLLGSGYSLCHYAEVYKKGS